jgi:hypothetical protein
MINELAQDWTFPEVMGPADGIVTYTFPSQKPWHVCEMMQRPSEPEE